MTIYDQLHALTAEYIKHYRGDLVVHDKRDIEANPGISFLHWTRESGTHIQFLWPADHQSWPAKGLLIPYLFGKATREHILDQVNAVADYWRNHGSIATHYYDGRELQAVTPERACQVAERHVRDVGSEWNHRNTLPKFSLTACPA
jgi:hypothetical protein